MSSDDDINSMLRHAEQQIDVQSSNLGLLRNEFMLNLDTLQSQYFPKMSPVQAVVFVCHDEQALLELKISWQEKKIVTMEQRGNKFLEGVDMAPKKKELVDSILPVLEDAYLAMDSVTKEELEVLRGYEHPPELVQKTINTLMVIRGEEDRSWAAAKVMLSETYYYSFFVYKAKMRVRQPVEGEALQALEAFCADPETTEGLVAKISRPCGTMTKWLRALRDFVRVDRVTAQKRQTPDEAREELKSLQEQLRLKKEDVAVAEKRLEALQEELKAKVAELRSRYDETMLPLQEMFFDAHQHFNSIYKSPERKRQHEPEEQ